MMSLLAALVVTVALVVPAPVIQQVWDWLVVHGVDAVERLADWYDGGPKPPTAICTP